MRINIVTGPFIPYPPAAAGGVEKAWFALATEFARRGHAVTVVGRAVPGRPREEVIDDVRCLRLLGANRSGSIVRDLIHDLAYSTRIARHIPGGDVTITNAFFLPVVLAVRRRARGRLVVHVGRFPKRQMPLYSAADLIHVPSGAVRNAVLKQRPAFANRVISIPYPVDTVAYSPNGAQFVENQIVYAGRVHPEKGVHLLVQAIASLPDPKPTLRLAGPTDVAKGAGGQAYIDELKRLANGVDIQFAGEIASPPDLAAELRRAAVMCYPSLARRGETFGIAPLESMAVGTPPIVSGLPVFAEHVIDGQTGVVFDHEREDAHLQLAEKLEALLASPGTRQRLSVNGVAHAQRFSVANVATMNLQAFASL